MEGGESCPNQVIAVNAGKSRHRRHRSGIGLQQKLLVVAFFIA
jgi:hypothetical protein